MSAKCDNARHIFKAFNLIRDSVNISVVLPIIIRQFTSRFSAATLLLLPTPCIEILMTVCSIRNPISLRSSLVSGGTTHSEGSLLSYLLICLFMLDVDLGSAVTGTTMNILCLELKKKNVGNATPSECGTKSRQQ